MRYSLSLALRRIRNDLKTYCAVVLQLFIGFSVLCTSLNTDFSMNSRLKELNREVSGSEIRVDIMNSSVSDGSFGFGRYAEMSTDQTCETGLITTAFIMAVNGGTPDTIAAICAPSRYYRDILGEDQEEGCVCCSEKLFDDIAAGKVDLFCNADISLSNEILTLNGKTFPISPIKGGGISKIRRDEYPDHYIDIDKVLLFPQEAGEDWEHEDSVSFSVMLYPPDADHYAAAYRMLYDHLDDISLSVSDPAASIIKKCQNIKDMIGLVTFISVTLLSVTVFGTVGILLIEIYKRKKDLAVASAAGASSSKLRAELFAETSIVCFFGICAGAVGAIPLTGIIKRSVMFFVTAYAARTLIIIFVSAVFIPAIVTAVSLFSSGGIDVVKSLRGEE